MSYHALNTHYVFFDRQLHREPVFGRVTTLEMVIPNLKLVVNPGAVSEEWHTESYLRPGQWILWVGVKILGTMVAFVGVMLVLHLN
ncbi:hypothetical protein BJV74DRAFT_859124, partial [Russula compacta]